MAAPKRSRSPRKAAQKSGLRELSRALRAFALALPGATEDFPWGERVAKVNGKVFVFLGLDPVAGGEMGFSVKLPESSEEVLGLPFTAPTGYGLGKSGWVTVPLADLPLEVLRDWVEESYRIVAPKRLVATLDGGR